jgi:hypothetical protein
VAYSSRQGRPSLEETILVAVSHRSILNRLSSLRYQKRLLPATGQNALATGGDDARSDCVLWNEYDHVVHGINQWLIVQHSASRGFAPE